MEMYSEDDISKLKQSDVLNKTYNFFTPKSFMNALLIITILSIIFFLIYLCKNYLKTVLLWIENQNPFMVFVIFTLLFVIVSFPITVGYLILIITSGYLFGIVKGLTVVIISANTGVFIAHNTLRWIYKHAPVSQIAQNETARGILRVISGPQAFKVILFARLTPIPFGLQNLIFSISTVSGKPFYIGTLLGLLPAQIINVYLGSTLRSMYEVLADQRTAFTGYCILAIQIIIGISLLLWVVHKARQELSLALQEAESLQGVCIEC